MNFKQSAIAVLQAAGEALHSSEITRRAMEEALLDTEGQTPEATMAAQLYTDIKRKQERSMFVQTAKNTFALNPAMLDRLPSVEEMEEEIAEEEEAEEQVKIEAGYIGSAGEHRVCSELLFRGFNASLMSVDEGIDIVAVKERVLISIQVKTANMNEHGDFHFNIRKKSFDRHKAHNVFYVFVLKNADHLDFLILPYTEMEKRYRQKSIKPVRQGTILRATMKYKDGSVFMGNLQHDMSYYLNNWAVIQ